MGLLLLLAAAAAPPPNTIEHVVLLLMENRPFDHFYGFAQPHLTEKIDGLTGKECVPSVAGSNALREYLAKPRPASAAADDDADDDETDDDAHDDDGDDGGDDDDDEPDETSTIGFRAADHPLDRLTKVLYNDYASEDKFVSFAYTDAPPGEAAGGHWLRATYTAVADAMPIRFDKVCSAAQFCRALLRNF
jgi:hypothetical protein